MKLAGKLVEKTWINRRRASVKAAAAQSSASGQEPVAIANLSVKAQKDRAFELVCPAKVFFSTVCFQSFGLRPVKGACNLARDGAEEEDRSTS